MTAAIQGILTLIGQIVPMLTSPANARLLGPIISTLAEVLPYVSEEIATLYVPVKNIISALNSSPAASKGQLAQLQALDDQLDAAFEAAAADTDAGI